MPRRRTPRISDAFLYKTRTRRVRDENLTDIAQSVARVIHSHLEGNLLTADSWIVAARALGARVQAFRYDTSVQGFYRGGAIQPVIYYNIAAPEHEKIRTIVHELAHHILATWPETVFPRTSWEYYQGDRQTTQHRIARLVEELLLGEDSLFLNKWQT